MAYIGVEPNPGRNREVDDISSGFNGSTTAFTLQVSSENISPGDANSIIVSLGGVIQNPNTDYTIAASTITFTTAPASGLSFFAVVQGQGTDTVINTPSDGSVTGTKLSNPLALTDDHKISFGTGADNNLEIFHESSSNTNEIIAADGDIHIQADNFMLISDDSGGRAIYLNNSGGHLELGFDGNHDARFTGSGVTLLTGIDLTGGAAANITALSDGATITIDMATACHHSVTLGGNRTFAAPSNQVVGQAGSIFITQDGTGSRTASFNSAFKFVGGTAPTLTTGAGLTDRIDYIIKSSNVIHCAVSLDVK